MARNRRNQSAAIRFGPALKALLLCLLIGGSGIGYVWQKGQLTDLGRQIKEREIRLGELRQMNERLKNGREMLLLPRMLKLRIEELNLGLVPPEPTQVWRLTEPLPEFEEPAQGTRVYAREVAPGYGALD